MKASQPSAKSVYKPATFFFLTFLVTWISWFLSAYFSFQENGGSIFVLFMLPGLVAPFAIEIWMIYLSGNKALKKNFFNKLFNLRLIRFSAIPAILLIMPVAVAQK